MPRAYTSEFENVTVTTAGGDADLFEFTSADDKPIEIVGLKVYTTSELKEAEEEWLRLRWIRGHTTSGSTPNSTPTPIPLNPNDAAAGFTVECYNTTIASVGTPVNCESFAFQVRAGYEFFYPVGCSIWASQASLLVLRLMAGPIDDVIMNATVWVNEYP